MFVPCPDGQEDGAESLRAQKVHGEVLAELDIAGSRDAQLKDAFNFPIKDLLGEAILGNPVAEHTAESGQFLKDRNLVAQAPEVVSRREAGRTTADDSHFFAGSGGDRTVKPPSGMVLPVG